MRLPLALEEKQLKMLILGAAEILQGRGPSSCLKIISHFPHFGYLREERKVSMQRWGPRSCNCGMLRASPFWEYAGGVRSNVGLLYVVS